MEFEIRQAFSDFSKTFSANSRSSSFLMLTTGLSSTSLIRYFRSTTSSLPTESDLKSVKSSLKFSATAKKVVNKQPFTAAKK